MRFFQIIVVLLFVLSGKNAVSQEIISSGRLSVTIENMGNGISITSIKDNGVEVLNESVNPNLFTLFIANVVTNTTEEIVAGNGWNSIDITNNGQDASIVLNNPINANLPSTLSVILSITTNDNKSSWDLSVSGLGVDCSLIDAIFPEFNINAPGNDTFLYPLYSGRLTENPGSGIDYFNDLDDIHDDNVGTYPRGWGTTMQFFSYYNADYGLYFGFHDPMASLKKFGIKNENGGIKINCLNPVPNMTITDNEWEFPGVFQLDLYNGNWYDAALVYKTWVSESATYFPQDTPERVARQHKIGEMGIWLTTSDFSTLSMAEMENYIQEAIDYFDVPVGVHIYAWNYSEMDHFYPVYFPERDGLSDLITSIQDNNDAVVMPYINGRLWDTGVGGNDPGDAEAATYFNNNGEASATKESDGTIYDELFESNIFATMCPVETDWQNILIDASNQVTGQDRLNADAVYIDMVAASAPTQCMDISHNHELGGGSFWREGYNQLFENIHSTIKTDAFITVEGGNDYLADEVDGFMVQGWMTDNQVPAWQVIYAGKVQLFGTLTGGSHYGLQKFYGRLSQGFSFGVQTGRQFLWLAINPESDPDKLMAATYVKSLSRMRYKLKDFLSYGEMKRPIILQSLPTGTTIPTITYDVWDWGGHRGTVSVTNPAIRTSVWQNANEVVVLFANGRIQSPAGTAGGTISFEFNFDPNDYGLTGDLTIQEITPTTETAVLTVDDTTFPKEVNLQNLELVAYKITGESTLPLNDLNETLFSIYPNPAKQSFTIHTITNRFTAKIYNSVGQVVIDNISSSVVNVSHLATGLYFVEVHANGRLDRKKLFVE
jgi:hypothetical protein